MRDITRNHETFCDMFLPLSKIEKLVCKQRKLLALIRDKFGVSRDIAPVFSTSDS